MVRLLRLYTIDFVDIDVGDCAATIQSAWQRFGVVSSAEDAVVVVRALKGEGTLVCDVTRLHSFFWRVHSFFFYYVCILFFCVCILFFFGVCILFLCVCIFFLRACFCLLLLFCMRCDPFACLFSRYLAERKNDKWRRPAIACGLRRPAIATAGIDILRGSQSLWKRWSRHHHVSTCFTSPCKLTPLLAAGTMCTSV